MNTPTRLVALAIAGSLVWGTSAMAQYGGGGGGGGGGAAMGGGPMGGGGAMGAGAAGLNAAASVDVNLRAGPSTRFPVVTVIPASSSISVIGCLQDLTWCDTDWNGNRGWMSARYITYTAAPAAPAVVVQPMPLPQIATQIQVPVVTYDIGPYWDAHYRQMAFYNQRQQFVEGAAGGLVGGLGGAAIGAAVAGPVGAAVGAAVGAGAGAAGGNPAAAPAAGALGGAAAGAVLGGPVGAAIGAGVGAAAGAAIPPPPPPVTTFVTQQQVASVTVPGTIAIGTTLPPPVTLYPVPDYQYQFAIVNQQRVLVDPGTRRIVYIMN